MRFENDPVHILEVRFCKPARQRLAILFVKDNKDLHQIQQLSHSAVRVAPQNAGGHDVLCPGGILHAGNDILQLFHEHRLCRKKGTSMKRVITITREFGSGGRTIAKELANRLIHGPLPFQLLSADQPAEHRIFAEYPGQLSVVPDGITPKPWIRSVAEAGSAECLE